ncbi:S-layer protein [Deinococcus phoenicis]|uniref:S-layer protein n=1 Tax=Deinococcus phoenicis TaxID=1476583 RepID=A0A016QN99_9DEIO|nr:DUF4384 domain-containing protein [Deinococcus phoenicis]EYB67600.1 S-layer protein [Deinococcus phoenicis]
MKKPAILLALTASLLTPLATPALAAPKISAQSIIVNPVPTTLEAKVWVDRDPSGTRTPNYRIGDRIRLSVSVNESAYVYLFSVSPDGSVDQVLPNSLSSGGNYVRKGEVRTFPAARDNFVFNVGGPAGLNKVLVVASRRQLNLSELSTFQAGEPFAKVNVKGSQQLAQALSIVVNPVEQPVPQQDWVSDTAFFNATY